jgi:NADPH2:quinone reductase
MGGAETTINLGHLMIKRHKVIGSTIRARSVEKKNKVMEELKSKVLPLFETGELIPIVHKTFSLSECEIAHEVMESNENIGKLVLTLD